MAAISLESTNPNFSWVLKKNPASGLQIKALRQGHIGFWFPSKDVFAIYFHEGENQVSYPTREDESFEYLNSSRYNASYFVLNAISEVLASAWKKADELDVEGFEHVLTLVLVQAKRKKYFDLFTAHFPEVEIQATELGPQTYNVVLKTSKTIQYLLCYTNLLAMFLSLRNTEVRPVIAIDKFLVCLQTIQSPYFVRYMFKANLLRSHNEFQKYKSVLEDCQKYWLVLQPGDSSLMRKQKVKKELAEFPVLPIIDIGCGEGFYARDFASLVPSYYAVDSDPEVLEIAKRRLGAKELESLTFHAGIEELEEVSVTDEPCNVLMVEVIEHMPIEDATKLVHRVLKWPGTRHVIITTPNKDFNQFFEFDEEDTRHVDHFFEFSKDGFEDWVLDVHKNTDDPSQFKTRIFGVGDKVNEHFITMMAVIEKVVQDEN